jgi:cysteine desulfurase / selenocysteine lyase
MLDVTAARADTPGTAFVRHLNNAGQALPPKVVVDTVIAHLQREAEIGGYEAHAEAEGRIAAVYGSVAQLMGVPAGRVALTTSATDAWMRAFQAVHFSGALTPGSRALVSVAEYASNVLPLLQLARSGVTVDVIPDGPDGALDVRALAAMLDDDVRLVAVTHAPSQNGLLNDVAGVGAALAQSGSDAWFIVDACQSVGQVPVDATAINADFVSVTGRKFLRGPRGTGFLTLSQRALELEPFPVDLHAADWVGLPGDRGPAYQLQPNGARYEYWEKSYAALLGMGAAIDYALGLGLDNIHEALTATATTLRSRLADLPGVTVLDRGSHKSAIVTFTKAGETSDVTVARIKSHGINVGRGTVSYALRDYRVHDIEGMIRVAPHVFNDESDIDALIAAI